MTKWIYTDADNTLWDTDALFAEAQLGLLDAAEGLTGIRGPSAHRLEYVRTFDQAIAARHHQQLRYPARLLVRALSDGLRGISAEVAAEQALSSGAIPLDVESEAIRIYEATLNGMPPILGGVTEGLRLAKERGIPVYVVSEGPLEGIRLRLQALGLERLTTSALSAVKSRELYMRLKQRAKPNQAVMIGDQPDRDIRLAHEAGLQTILVFGRFRPKWTNSADVAYADATAEDFLEAIQKAIRLDRT